MSNKKITLDYINEPKGSEMFRVRCHLIGSEGPSDVYLLEDSIVSYDKLHDESGMVHYVLKERWELDGSVSFNNFKVAHTWEDALKLMHSRAKDSGVMMRGKYGVENLVDSTDFASESLPRGGK